MTIFLHKQAEQLSDVKNYVIKAGKEMIEHTFAVCAYGESPYLEKSIRSVIKQSVKSRVIVCTSTPNSYIENLTKKYHLPYYVRQGESSLQDDWNYAYDKAGTEYVTLTHQDDIYHKDYLKYMTVYLERYSDTLIAMTDYRIINQDQQVRWDVSLMVKQMLKLPLRIPFLADKRWVKLGIQAFGNGICCPSVCYHRTLLGNSIFQSGYHYALDWEMFVEIAKKQGRFTYIPKNLFYYRIHEGATTKVCLKNQEKMAEELEMFQKFWPDPVVRVLMHFYKFGYRSYEK